MIMLLQHLVELWERQLVFPIDGQIHLYKFIDSAKFDYILVLFYVCKHATQANLEETERLPA